MRFASMPTAAPTLIQLSPARRSAVACRIPAARPIRGSTACCGGLFPFNGHADIKQLALYAQDAITVGNWTANLGLRGDLYNGLSSHGEAEPRVGLAYNFKKTNTVFRVSYARLLETPFNENLVLSSTGCAIPVLNPLLVCSSSETTPFSPGWRNEF